MWLPKVPTEIWVISRLIGIDIWLVVEYNSSKY
jgi:hypothetical protein